MQDSEGSDKQQGSKEEAERRRDRFYAFWTKVVVVTGKIVVKSLDNN
jgi:hypothetical protein